MSEIERMEKTLRDMIARGYTVTVMNALAFLAGYQVDLVPIEDVYNLLDKLRKEGLLSECLL